MLRRPASLGSGAYGGGWRGEDAVGACTESLGSETGDVGGDAEIDHQLGQHAADEEEEEDARAEEPHHQAAAALSSPEKRPRRLPPPMPRAAEGAFSMRAERRGGRLILTEVRIEQRRREVFRASRAGGRLRLQFAADREGSRSPDGGEREAAENSDADAAAGGGVVGGCCSGGGAGEFCQVAVGARRSRVEIGAAVGT